MRHEGFDFTVDVWDEEKAKSDENNAWHGNVAVPHLIFDDKNKFEEKLGKSLKLNMKNYQNVLYF